MSINVPIIFKQSPSAVVPRLTTDITFKEVAIGLLSRWEFCTTKLNLSNCDSKDLWERRSCKNSRDDFPASPIDRGKASRPHCIGGMLGGIGDLPLSWCTSQVRVEHVFCSIKYIIDLNAYQCQVHYIVTYSISRHGLCRKCQRGSCAHRQQFIRRLVHLWV